MGVRRVCIADPYNRTVFVTDENGRVIESESLHLAFRIREDRRPLEFDFSKWFDEL